MLDLDLQKKLKKGEEYVYRGPLLDKERRHCK